MVAISKVCLSLPVLLSSFLGKGIGAVNVKTSHEHHQADLAAKFEALMQEASANSNTLAARLRELNSKKKQEPAASGVDPTVDAAGYEEDWQNEHKEGPYPESAEGKEHDEDYGENVKPALERALFLNSWFFWISAGVFIILATAAGAKLYSGRAASA